MRFFPFVYSVNTDATDVSSFDEEENQLKNNLFSLFSSFFHTPRPSCTRLFCHVYFAGDGYCGFLPYLHLDISPQLETISGQ